MRATINKGRTLKRVSVTDIEPTESDEAVIAFAMSEAGETDGTEGRGRSIQDRRFTRTGDSAIVTLYTD